MPLEKPIKIKKKIIKTYRGKTSLKTEDVKTDGSPESIKKNIEALKKMGTSYFEIINQTNHTKTVYTKTLSGTTYEKKVFKL